jgi:hypothetical protein
MKEACDLNDHMRAAHSDGDLTGEGAAVGRIKLLLGTSDDFDLRFAANMLKDWYDLAVAARGTGEQFSTSAQLLGASIKLSTACIKAGWKAT